MRRRRNNSKVKWLILGLVALIAFLAAACGFFYAKDQGVKDTKKSETPISGERIVSLLNESTEAQRLLDNILLQKDNWQLKENGHAVREAVIDKAGNKVKINHRDLAIGVPPDTSLPSAGVWLKEKSEAAGLVFISGKMSEYKTWDAFRAEIGIKAKSGTESKNFVTDTIYIFHNLNLRIPDKDIKPAPEARTEPKAAPKPETRRFSGKLAVIIDDCGQNLTHLRTLLNTGLAFSYAVLPDKAYSSDTLAAIKAKGRVAMLHLPMEPLDAAQMSEGANTIRVAMTDAEKLALLRKHLKALQGVTGVNNHQGSKATADLATMKLVLQELKKQKMFFVDSRTNSKSIAMQTAKNLGVRTSKNDIYLDNSSDPEEIRKQIYKACELAEKNGSAVAICHVRTGTAKAWQQYAEEIKATGIQIVPITAILN